MKKIITAAVVAGMVVSFGGISTIAADTTPERGTISVSTTANAEISPDTVDISISVKTKDSKSLQKASNENKLISDNVYNALKDFINSQNGDYLKTADYNARPVYTYTSNNKKILDKYEVSNNIIVHTKNIEQAGAMIDKAISLGATDVNDLRFSVSNYEKQCNELLEIASKKAKTRADITVKASGSYITGVKNLSISCSENTPSRVQYRLMTNKMAMANGASYEADAAPSTPIQSGVIKIFANLNAVYFIK
ncbi:MAG: SIMPL domain-containing protein [Candidatus Gastranaerophilaceae bacterium]|nr:SIMPL domain-containing protein [Candidatus Gastranaerophilaceae bacterium]